MKWKLSSLGGSSFFAHQDGKATTSELYEKINTILNTNSQYSPSELGIWSNIINGKYDFAKFTQELSGRDSVDSLEKMISALVKDENILALRSTPDASALTELEKVLKQLWWIIVALVGVGVLVASSISVATKDRQIKLSARPVLKWLLISGIILGLTVATLAILFGVVL